MPKLDSPLLLTPDLKTKIWGRSNLDPLYPGVPEGESAPSPRHRGSPKMTDRKAGGRGTRSPDTAEARIGEAWLTGDGATFRNGPVAGLTLGEVARRWPAELLGEAASEQQFPVLAKFLFTDDWLSVQVHPDDEYARRHEKAPGKAEMWYFIDCDRQAHVALGLKPGTTREELAAACLEQRSRELLQIFRPEKGEAAFVPAGTVHALGPGLVLFEAGENSTVTYRLDDYGRLDEKQRPRELHLERGLETVRPEVPAYRNLPRLEFSTPFGARRYVMACPLFAVEEIVLESRATFTGSPARAEGLAAIAGEGRVETTAGWLGYRTGQTWLVPPAAPAFRLVPEEPTRLLRFYLPDLERDFRQPLIQLGVAPDTIRQVVFGDQGIG
jgi:mannose-6-phosphate isomerase